MTVEKTCEGIVYDSAAAQFEVSKRCNLVHLPATEFNRLNTLGGFAPNSPLADLTIAFSHMLEFYRDDLRS